MSNNSTKSTDRYQRSPIAIAPVPQAPNMVLAATFTIGSNSIATVNSTVTPGFSSLSLWDFLWSAYIDVNLSHSHRFLGGESLTSAQFLNISAVDNHVDWIDSNDILNTRIQRVTFKNTDSSSHTIYFYLKSYTFAAVTGDIA